MKKYNRILMYVIFSLLIYTNIVIGQTTEECLVGPSGTLAKQQAAPNGDPANFINFIPSDTISIKLKIHRVRYSNQTGGLSDSEIEEAIETLNSFYKPAKMKFVPYDLIDNINSNTYAEYNLGTNISGCDAEINKNIFSLNKDPNAINIYFIPKLKEGNDDSGVRGFAEGYGENSFLVRNASANTVTIAHEMGHSLNLYHPHDTCAFGPENITRETYDSCYNADIAGDKLSDTPADPGNPKYQDANCNFNATNPDPDECDSTNYDPDMYNIVSYYKDYCRTTFTPQQIGKMHDYLKSSFHFTKNVTLSNQIGNTNQTGTQLYIDDNAIDSGDSTDLFVDIRYNSRTASEIINSTHKHHDWDEDNTQFRLSEDFIVEENTEQRVAKFVEINTGYIKNNLMEVSGADLGLKQFKDPWWVDATNNQPDEYRSLSSSESVQIVFKEQSGPPSWSPPYYSVKTTSSLNIDLSQTGKTHRFYFQNWSGTNVTLEDDEALETAVVFNSNNAEVKADLKGTNLSNNPNAYISSSQRKFVAIQYSYTKYLLSTYESLGKIWIEYSEDDGNSWVLINNGQSVAVGTNPSITATSDGELALVYNEVQNNSTKVKLKTFRVYSNFDEKYDEDLHWYSGVHGTHPVITHQYDPINQGYVYLIVWEMNNSGSGVSPGLYYISGIRTTSGTTWNYNFNPFPSKISNTDANSTSPTLAAKYNHTYFHLAWEQEVSSGFYDKEIRYYKINRSTQNVLTFSHYYVPSAGGVFFKNYSPTMTVVDNGGLYITCVGIDDNEQINQVVLRCRHTSNWWYSTFYKYGSRVDNVSINSAEYPNQYYYGFAWVENGSTNYYKASTISGIQTLNTTGNYVQLANGLGSCNNMQAMTFKNTSIPYAFTVSEKFGTGLNKSNSTQDFEGREGIVSYPSKDKSEIERYYYTISDVMVDGNPIKFIELAENVMINNINDLNEYLTTESFELSKDSEITYNTSFGLLARDIEGKQIKNGKKVKFNVELIDAESGKILGNYDEVDLSKEPYNYKNKNTYKVKPNIKKNNEVKLRLFVEDDDEGEYIIGSIMSKSNVLKKDGVQEIITEGNLIVSDYKLSQNYPNPFNPETTINYQIPKDGLVTLKVYDALGKEATELVNGYKSAGSYDVIFDGSKLATGIYFYKLTSGDFTETKKLILMK